MLNMLRPRLYLPSIYDIDLPALARRGIGGLILDLDNTLVKWNEPGLTPDLRAWIARARRQRLELCIVSNNLGPRVDAFTRASGVSSIARAAKPRTKAFRIAMRRMGTDADSTAVVGDQVFTDILGGNRLHLFTILVRPLDPREFWTTRAIRRVERWLVSSGAGETVRR